MRFSGIGLKGSSLAKGLLALAISGALLFQSPVFAVSINSATQEVLQNVKGVGPAKARAIIAEREKRGAFQSPEDLSSRVKGIGMKTIVKITDSGITFELPESPPASRSVRSRSRD